MFKARTYFLVLFFVFLAGYSHAQSTIFNIPSTDVQQRKHVYFEADFISHFDRFENNGFQTYGYRTVYGAKKNFEIGVNFFYTRNGSHPSPKQLQPNFKLKLFENERHKIAVTTGAILFTSLNRKSGEQTYGLFYSNVSKNISRTGGTRLTAGYYTVSRTDRNFGSKKGFILGFEQPLRGKINFIADWYSGKNNFGYTAAGLSYTLTKRQFLTAGYNFGNTGRGNNAFSAFYGITY